MCFAQPATSYAKATEREANAAQPKNRLVERCASAATEPRLWEKSAGLCGAPEWRVGVFFDSDGILAERWESFKV